MTADDMQAFKLEGAILRMAPRPLKARRNRGTGDQYVKLIPAGRPPRIHLIEAAVAEEYGVSLALVLCGSRLREHTEARWEIWRRIYEQPTPGGSTINLSQIARWYGVEVHATNYARRRGWVTRR